MSKVVFAWLAIVSVACAEWRGIGDGYFVTNPNDGWYYRQQCATVPVYYGYCNKCVRYETQCSYVRYSAIPVQQTIVKNVRYSKNWKNDLLEAIERQKDSELFIQAVRESGLRSGIAGGNVNNAVLNSDYYAKGAFNVVNGYPYAEQGSTAYGLAAYVPNIGKIDVENALHLQSQLAQQLIQVTGQTSVAFGDRVGQIGEAQKEIAKIQAASAAIVETVRASQPRTQASGNLELHSGAGARAAAAGVIQDNAARLAQTLQQPGALARVKAGQLMVQACVQCHGPEKAEARLRLDDFDTWDGQKLATMGPKIKVRIITTVPEDIMPPVDSDVQALNTEEKMVILGALP